MEESFLQFILDNPIFVIFIIGMIVSFFKKTKEGNSQNQPAESDWKKMLGIPETINDNQPTDLNPRTEMKSEIGNLTQEYYEIKTKSEVYQPQVREQRRNTRAVPLKKNEDVTLITKDEIIDLTPNKENIIEGIVWSEILGPPRALKSHTIRRPSLKR
jgi:hypothetical protein